VTVRAVDDGPRARWEPPARENRNPRHLPLRDGDRRGARQRRLDRLRQARRPVPVSTDASKGYQLTFDGGYSSPSQAEDGTIGALHYKQLVRLNRSGQPLNAPIEAMGSDGTHGIGGPYEPRISPDGRRFAYYFYVRTSTDDLEHNIRWLNTGSYGTWTWADHFTSPATESEYNQSLVQTEWVTNDRLLGTLGMYLNMWTWKLGTRARLHVPGRAVVVRPPGPARRVGRARLPLVRPARAHP
jgi:hypothetical protein